VTDWNNVAAVDQGNGNGGSPPSGPPEAPLKAPGKPDGLRRFVKGASPGKGASEEMLRRFQESQRPKPKPGEACEMCATPVPAEHGHVVNIDTRELMCVCRACYLLFAREGSAQGKFRQVPERYLFDPYFALDNAQWEQIQIPVSMAFFFFNSSMNAFVAFYPSPAGATESLLDLDAWREVIEANPSFEGLMPDVEALLLRQEDDRFECYLVPIDKAYELTALVRMNWKGFSGGQEVWETIATFFDDLKNRSAVVGLGPRGVAGESEGGK
jgi:hypothetical protein